MSKKYKITYKPYPNKRLKKVSFHDQVTYPIYIQVTYQRRSNVFKSYYFDLLSRPRYVLDSKLGKISPSLEEIVSRDHSIMKHVIKNAGENATLESLIKDYYFYSKDLCEVTEDSFHAYMFLFFVNNGLNILGKVLSNGSHSEVLYDVLDEFSKALKPEIYERLVNDSLQSGQPYIPLYGFVIENRKPPYSYLSVMDWQEESTQIAFSAYVEQNFPDHPADIIIAQVNRLIDLFLIRTT